MSRLQSIMGSSGLSPDQLRDRLRAQGYSPSLLDQYLPGARGADSTSLPSDDALSAVAALGLADSASVDSLRAMMQPERDRVEKNNAAFVDSLLAAVEEDETRAAVRAVLASREAREAIADSGFTMFGRSLFERTTSEFDPNNSVSVGPDYALGPGDRLVLLITGDTEKAYQLEVTRQGFIVIPEVGQISVANLTLGQLEDQLYTHLRRVYSGVRRSADATTRFSVNVSRVGSSQIHVTGDVQKPGAYQVSRAGSVLTALYLAQGPSAAGSMRNVQVRRAGTLVGTLDIYDYALRGVSSPIALKSGDIVFVPPKGGDVRITGAVRRPATYELRDGETLADAIAMAGGFRPDADTRFLRIDRIVPPEQRTSVGSSRRMIDVAATAGPQGGMNVPLRPGDVLHVLRVPERRSNRVRVEGNVWQPGPIALEPGMTLATALRRAGGVKPDSYLGEVIVTRLLADSSREMLSTALRDTLGTTATEVVLQDGDEIEVFALAELRTEQYVTIAGAVKDPGRIPYRAGMTLRQLVLLAGGLREDALLTQAEVARIPANRAAGVVAETQRVALDSTYLLGLSAHARGATDSGANGTHNEVYLQPYDAVLIMRQPNWQAQQEVVVVGEVRFPGTYALRTRGERIADIITRAGGLSDQGYANGVVFVRTRGRVGRIGLNLPAVLKNRRHSDNILLVGGDSIEIPRYEPIVRVRGSVNAPVAVAYVPGQNVDYYINAAGGGTAKADTKRAFVTQANGKVESRSSYLGIVSWVPKPQPGSVVVVPEKDETTGFNFAAFFSTTASVLTAIVALVAVSR